MKPSILVFQTTDSTQAFESRFQCPGLTTETWHSESRTVDEYGFEYSNAVTLTKGSDATSPSLQFKLCNIAHYKIQLQWSLQSQLKPFSGLFWPQYTDNLDVADLKKLFAEARTFWLRKAIDGPYHPYNNNFFIVIPQDADVSVQRELEHLAEKYHTPTIGFDPTAPIKLFDHLAQLYTNSKTFLCVSGRAETDYTEEKRALVILEGRLVEVNTRLFSKTYRLDWPFSSIEIKTRERVEVTTRSGTRLSITRHPKDDKMMFAILNPGETEEQEAHCIIAATKYLQSDSYSRRSKDALRTVLTTLAYFPPSKKDDTMALLAPFRTILPTSMSLKKQVLVAVEAYIKALAPSALPAVTLFAHAGGKPLTKMKERRHDATTSPGR